jgi:GNAT superfamily N-acetyltransferase
MAALTSQVQIRGPQPGDGTAVAGLWRELWDAHEAWGGYAGAKDEETYAAVATRLDADAQARRGSPVMGRHVHLVAAVDGRPVGQVEGWIDRYGIAPTTPTTCEVRSLIVTAQARVGGVGRALLDALGDVATAVAQGPAALAAEVLEPNPAHTFYEKLGFRPVAWTTRVDTRNARWPEHARIAGPKDAQAVAALDAALLARRRLSHDPRFDPPRSIDATMLGALAAHLTRSPGEIPAELVALDATGTVRASATLVVMHLDPPFVPAERAALGRVSVDPAADPGPLLRALMDLGSHLARQHGARTLELTDLTWPRSPLHDLTLQLGAVPWSRIVTKVVRPRR